MKSDKIQASCRVCGRKIRVFQEADLLCPKHYKEKQSEAYSVLADAIMQGIPTESKPARNDNPS